MATILGIQKYIFWKKNLMIRSTFLGHIEGYIPALSVLFSVETPQYEFWGDFIGNYGI